MVSADPGAGTSITGEATGSGGSAAPNTDIAALGGSVVAVAMTLFGDEGPYDLFGVAISATLFLLILGYVLPHDRKGWKRWGVAAVIGLVFAPMTGYLMEQRAGPWTQCDAWNDQRVARLVPRPAAAFPADDACGDIVSIGRAVQRAREAPSPDEPRSTVGEGATLLGWLAIALLFLAWDGSRARLRDEKSARFAEDTQPRSRSGPAAGSSGGDDG